MSQELKYHASRDEAMQTMRLWIDMMIAEQEKVDEPGACDIEERRFIEAAQVVLGEIAITEQPRLLINACKESMLVAGVTSSAPQWLDRPCHPKDGSREWYWIGGWSEPSPVYWDEDDQEWLYVQLVGNVGHARTLMGKVAPVTGKPPLNLDRFAYPACDPRKIDDGK